MKSAFAALDRCTQTDYYEAAVVRARPLRIRYRLEGREQQAELLPLDLVARDGVELLLARSAEGALLSLPLAAILWVEQFEHDLSQGR